ncbi:MAG: HEAT repeat domain-containing protein [Deltaproteobacteria bacterium]|nr:HEAT repeat domain-containing protein [Deltaproteobacteria bacterium]
MKYTKLVLLYLVPLLMVTVGSSVVARSKRTKKRSLAEIAAMEWKLEQATDALQKGGTPQARLAALVDLASIDDARVVRPLALSLREDPSAEVRKKALEAIAHFRTPEVKGLLLLTSQGDPRAGLREQAKGVLAKFPKRMKPARLVLRGKAFVAPKKVDDAAIKRALASPSGEARLWAVGVVATLKTLKMRQALLAHHLGQDPSARVRARCAEALASMGKKQLPRLIKAIEDGDPTVRFQVAQALARFDDAGVLRVLQQVAQADVDATVRAEVRDLLEPSTRVGRRLLRERIAKLSSPNPAQRIAAMDDLAQFTQWRALQPMACSLLRDKSVQVRAKAARVLSTMHDTTVLAALRAAAAVEPDAAQKKLVRKLLKGLRRRVDQLVKELKAKDETTRVRAARLLGQAAYPPGLAPLIVALKDASPRVQRAAARALTHYHEKAASAALKRASGSADSKVRAIIAQRLRDEKNFAGWRRFYKNADRMVAKLFDKDPIWRRDAALALAIAGVERAGIHLIRILAKDKDESVRLAAAWALVLMPSPAAEKALKIAAAKDKSERVRLATRKYLVIDKVSVDDLRQQLSDSRASVRADAAEALSLRASGRVQYDMIRAAVCDPAADVRASALRALARIGSKLAKSVMRTAMRRDNEKRVKRTALVMYILAGGR